VGALEGVRLHVVEAELERPACVIERHELGGGEATGSSSDRRNV
jgi:hypothetical protein